MVLLPPFCSTPSSLHLVWGGSSLGSIWCLGLNRELLKTWCWQSQMHLWRHDLQQTDTTASLWRGKAAKWAKMGSKAALTVVSHGQSNPWERRHRQSHEPRLHSLNKQQGQGDAVGRAGPGSPGPLSTTFPPLCSKGNKIAHRSLDF